MRDQETLVETETVIDRSNTNGDLQLDPVTGFSSLLTLCHLTPFVLAARIPKLIAETSIYSPFEREETRLAITEKAEASVEGAVAFQRQFAASVLSMQMAFLQGQFMPKDYFAEFGDLAVSALTPSVERLQSNADRLG